ncbi:MAG: N-acetylneuraminate synthase family protein [Patescibacteria group bacterium]
MSDINPLTNDLDQILNLTPGLWEELRGKRLFITGGTGFFGCWFLESFIRANEKFDLQAEAVVLTRSLEEFKKKAPHLADNSAIKFQIGDVRNFEFPVGEFSHIIHAAATSAVATFNNEDPLVKFETVVEGTRHTLDFAVHSGAKKFLYTSSGVVYGKQPADISNIPEEYNGAPDPTDINSVWGESKRAAEFLCGYYANKYGIEIKIARCFSFVGPHLPLDVHYAVGNFIRDGSNGGPIQVKGDGTTVRSYLYAADLMVWLWTILFKGQSCRPYNVGSQMCVTIAELAQKVAQCLKRPVEVKIAQTAKDGPPEQYVPSTERAQTELGLKETVGLEEAIKRTINFLQGDFTNIMENIEQIFSPQGEKETKPLFIFEMANNHMGDVEHGLKIIREMHEVSKDFPEFQFAFKFQYRDLDTFIHPDYKDRMDLKYIKRFSETRLSAEQFLMLKNEAKNFGFLTICTPFDEKSVENVVSHDYDIIKVASASFTDWPLWEKIAQYDKPIIASTGGVKLEDIDKVVSFLEHRNKKFAIMHCVGQYPTPEDQLQFNQITLLRERYPEVTIGYSTHEAPDNFEAIKMAVAKGARIFEKHVGVKTDKYALNAYSALPEQVKKWLESARQAYRMRGVSGKRHDFAPQELADIRQFQRGAYAAVDIKAGEKVDMKNTFFAFPNQDGQILANELSKYTIFTATKDFKAKEPIMAADVAKMESREKVYEAVEKINKLLRQANIAISNKWDFDLSHHYGLDKFYEYGASLITCLNREYCKKLIVLLPGQQHPCHYHKIKEETFHVLYGDATFVVDGKPIESKAGDIVTLERGTKHSFGSKNGCVFEEISTTHIPGDSYYDDESILGNKNRKTTLTYWIV